MTKKFIWQHFGGGGRGAPQQVPTVRVFYLEPEEKSSCVGAFETGVEKTMIYNTGNLPISYSIKHLFS